MEAFLNVSQESLFLLHDFPGGHFEAVFPQMEAAVFILMMIWFPSADRSGASLVILSFRGAVMQL